ncbi:MmcQ/YjbR family DNA-binding protein [Rhizosphaericola mali]|uniref:MmcQ/YjbR family DNA-binding protein n=1 Tax=Rhizosphaericola mali TaxID=2545455 RepID=A0A5P2GEE3_9BACT|nr:MmcQ/YjbR family DNA-binding protein [Rhizosphaericola mali]QES89981.1 MmcQ/YjbR family DNA-binding protein [Rhizosphaericola mali]
MNIEQIRDYALQKENVEECFPFGEETLVFKTGGKIFLLAGLESFPASINLKCDPDRALELREEYEDITPGFHMNKKHWNTVMIESRIPAKLIKEMIDHSYSLVLPKSKKS